MKPVDQLVLHRPEEGQHGDCMRAMICTLLDLKPDQVPHFLEDGISDGAAFNRRVNDFLRPRNLAYLPVGDLSDFFEPLGITGLHHEISGQTERGTCHACAAVDGVMVHDPHPSRAGLLKVDSYGVFIVLDPSKGIAAP